MSKITKYEDRRQVAAGLAVTKAKVHGKSAWPFDYRGQQVVVSAEKKGGKIRVHTDNVANKGK